VGVVGMLEVEGYRRENFQFSITNFQLERRHNGNMD